MSALRCGVEKRRGVAIGYPQVAQVFGNLASIVEGEMGVELQPIGCSRNAGWHGLQIRCSQVFSGCHFERRGGARLEMLNVKPKPLAQGEEAFDPGVSMLIARQI